MTEEGRSGCSASITKAIALLAVFLQVVDQHKSVKRKEQLFLPRILTRRWAGILVDIPQIRSANSATLSCPEEH